MVTKFFEELEKNYTYHSPGLVDRISQYASQLYERQKALEVDIQMPDGTTRKFPATHNRILKTSRGIEYTSVVTNASYDSSGNMVYDVIVRKKETLMPTTPPAIDEDVFAALDDAVSNETIAGRFDNEFNDLANGRGTLLSCLGRENLHEESNQG